MDIQDQRVVRAIVQLHHNVKMDEYEDLNLQPLVQQRLDSVNLELHYETLFRVHHDVTRVIHGVVMD